MNDLRAYEVSIDDVRVVAEYLGEIGTIYEQADLWDIVYATTPSKAKHIFIKQYNEGYEHAGLEYTDPISVRLLAKNVVETDELTRIELSADWCKADLTARGRELVENWKFDENYDTVEYVTDEAIISISTLKGGE